MMKIVFTGGPLHGARWTTSDPFAPKGEVWIARERYVWAAPPIPMNYGELLIFDHA